MPNRDHLPPEFQQQVRNLKDASGLPLPVQWHEGMLLSPQHFQQLCLWQEGILNYQTAAVAPFCWGVRRFQVDTPLLLKGIFRVSELEAIMPDGLVVSLSGGNDLRFELEPRKAELQRDVIPIQLIVPSRKSGQSAVKGENARFDSIEGEAVYDENTGDGELRIPRLRPRLRLLLTKEPPGDYVSLPLAKLAYSDNKYELADDFVPPMFRVSPDSEIGKICSSIIQQMWGKADFLLKVKVPHVVATRIPQLLETKLFIQSLVSALPRFQALLQTGASHPYTLYLELCSLAGLLAVIRRHELTPPELPSYDHNDLHQTFELARNSISRILEEEILESYTDYPFMLLQKQIFYIEFAAEWLGQRLIIGVKGKPDQSDKEVIEWTEQSVIASRGEIKRIQNMRILGAQRTRIESDEEFLPSRGVSLFSLDSRSPYIKPNDTLIIQHPSQKPCPQEIVLYVKNPSAKSVETVQL